MKKISIDEAEHVDHPVLINEVRKPVSNELGTTDFAMVYNELAPGEAFSAGLHTHYDQEEVFYIVEGRATFDVGLDRERVTVEAGEIIRFVPGEFQLGYNETDERVVGFIFGAPGPEHDWAEVEMVIHCRGCDQERIHRIEPVGTESWQADHVHIRQICEECGNTFTTDDIIEG